MIDASSRSSTLTIPNLETSRLQLRPFHMNDASDVQRMAGDYEVARTTLNIPHPYADGMAEEWISGHAQAAADGERITWAVALASGELVGAISLMLTLEHRRGELGYWIGRTYWRNGYATEATRAVIAHGFDVLNLHRIEARHIVDNPASGRVMQKVGMRYEGTQSDLYWRFDRWHDICVYGLLASVYSAVFLNHAVT